MTTATLPGTNGTIHDAIPRTDDLVSPPQWFNLSVRIAMRALYRRMFDVHVTGIEHVPSAGPVILAQNHLNELDGPMVAAMSPRPIHAVTKSEAFHGAVGKGVELFGQISIDRSLVDVRAIRRTIRTLRDDRVVSIFPEGKRGAGDFAYAHSGLAYLALVTGAPIVPLALLGTRLPGGSIDTNPPRGSRIDLVFGSPIRIEAIPYPRRQHTVRALTERLRLQLRDHVEFAVELTGNRLPGPPPVPDPDSADDPR